MTAKTNRSYVLQTVISKNGSWNNDFDGMPKQYNNQFFASDRALKYAVRHLMEQMGLDVFIKDWIVANKDKGKKKESKNQTTFYTMPNTELKAYIKEKTGKEFSETFWTFADIRQFGFLYDNLSLHGVAQISQGLDLYRKGTLYEDDLTGRMVFGSKDKSDKETRGMASRTFLSEAHYCYETSINPANVKFLEDIEGFEHCVYTEEDFALLLECLHYGPSNIKSTQKLNCYTGFMVQIDLIDGEKTHLGNLQGKLTIEDGKENRMTVYNLQPLFDYLKRKEEAAGHPIYQDIVVSYEASEIVIKGIHQSMEEVKIKKL
ncbi:type I CRISPR-associated protein Cas7 [Metabacillus hrfriensis]|uniref:Type I CRISPR-associated protein Cas7 n=1 Tax=Metabacillus hrfriensis TaxID=3048891 RepID=A0ACD4RHU6_9BACI|nr:type I CRISPR-associated protein Cas7 [Metabacillus sp. CT-WN-B3]WHZ60081.1 type I CRISPR-associated protein Cas7 [Metabacillus sp. CT-WN-B3]